MCLRVKVNQLTRTRIIFCFRFVGRLGSFGQTTRLDSRQKRVTAKAFGGIAARAADEIDAPSSLAARPCTARWSAAAHASTTDVARSRMLRGFFRGRGGGGVVAGDRFDGENVELGGKERAVLADGGEGARRWVF